MNETVPWTSYWPPLRYILLIKLAHLFDEEQAKLAWAARIDVNRARANQKLIQVCHALIERVDRLPDARSRELISDGLLWAAANPDAIEYNVEDANDIKQISPNIIGFQSVMHGIAKRIISRGKKASRIVVDRQSEFNKAQRTLSEFFAAASGLRGASGPGMPELSLAGMPKTPIEFVPGTESAGLELVDLYLWIFKRIFERKEIAAELRPLIEPQFYRGHTDVVSLSAISRRWSRFFSNLPELDELSDEKIEAAKKSSNRRCQETERSARDKRLIICHERRFTART